MTRIQPWRDVRTRLLGIVLIAITVALSLAGLAFNILFSNATSQDADASLHARAASELELIRVTAGNVRVVSGNGDPLGDSRVWIFIGSRVIEQPSVRAVTERAARSLVGGPERTINLDETDERLLAVPIVHAGSRIGTLVTGISLAPYEHARRTALSESIILFAGLVALVGFVVWWLLRSALRPVAEMTEQAEAWSEHELDRRFALGEPHDELTRLAATLDGLLDRLAASLRHERHFSAEMSHELRTPLAKLMAEAELALRRKRSGHEYRESLEVVLRNAQQLERIVETLVTAARQPAEQQGVASAVEVAEATVAACSDEAASRGVAVEVVGPRDGLRLGVDRDLAERILHPVVENACRYGHSIVHVSIARDGSAVLFAVDDDGPGVGADEEESIFEPAVRGRAGRSATAGAGLGLALSRRLARAASGDVEARPDVHGRFVVRLPAA
ncbi:MAG TPA: ATP-binding protein [Gaiellaceae bacterium]|nr:ATP-binding protein [Gaiellaceae bacterium]